MLPHKCVLRLSLDEIKTKLHLLTFLEKQENKGNDCGIL